MAKPILLGRDIQLQRRGDTTLNSLDLDTGGPVVGPPPPGSPYPAVNDFTGLPQTPDGWTDLLAMFQTPGKYEPDNCTIVYVSTSDGTANGGFYRKYHTAIGGNEVDVPGNPFAPPGPIAAFNSVTAALALIQNGKADILLFKRGDVFTTGLGNWKSSGISNSERMIIAAYGTGDKPTFNLTTGSFFSSGGNYDGQPRHDLIVADLRSYPLYRDVTLPEFDGTKEGSAVQILHPWSNLLYENVELVHGQWSLQNERKDEGYLSTNIAMRRCITYKSSPKLGNAKAQGSFISSMSSVLVEESLYAYGGWDPGIYDQYGWAGPHALNHNMYFSKSNDNVVWRRNISYQPSAQGLQGRSGGILENNLFMDCPYSGFLGGGGGSISYNVVLGGRQDGTVNDGWGIMTQSSAYSKVHNNIVAHLNAGVFGRVGIALKPHAYTEENQGWNGVSNPYFDGPAVLDVCGNVTYKWGGPQFWLEDFVDTVWPAEYATAWEAFFSSLLLANNRFHTLGTLANNCFPGRCSGTIPQSAKDAMTFSNNEFYSPVATSMRINPSTVSFAAWQANWNGKADTDVFSAPTYTDPERNAVTYLDTLSVTGDNEDFINLCRAMMDKGSWDWRLTAPAFNQYIRAGFGVMGSE